ncbi:hypothetical protein BDR26DRAFT_857277 [Obelidium mucronatum]|nr:hypothetical protein BDR26DRAFT_857277 [Obelidium mucronatum]
MDRLGARPLVALLFAPYYVVLGTSGLFHMLAGVSKAMRILTSNARWDAWTHKPALRRRVFVASLAAMTATVLAINGYLGDWQGDEWAYVDAATQREWHHLHETTFKYFSFGLL